MLSALSPTNSCYDITRQYHRKKRSEPFDFRQCLMENRIHKLQTFDYHSRKRLFHSNSQSELALPNLSPRNDGRMAPAAHPHLISPINFHRSTKRLNVFQLIFCDNDYNDSEMNEELIEKSQNRMIDELLSTIEKIKPEIVHRINEVIQLDALYDYLVKQHIKENSLRFEKGLLNRKNSLMNYSPNNDNSQKDALRGRVLNIKHIKFNEILDGVITHCLEVVNSHNKLLSIENISSFFDEEVMRIKEFRKTMNRPRDTFFLRSKGERGRGVIDNWLLHNKARTIDDQKHLDAGKLMYKKGQKMTIYHLGSKPKESEALNRIKRLVLHYTDFHHVLNDIDDKVCREKNISKDILKQIKEAITAKYPFLQTPIENDDKETNTSKTLKPIPLSMIKQLHGEIKLSKEEKRKVLMTRTTASFFMKWGKSRNIKYTIKECQERNLSGNVDSDKISFSYQNNNSNSDSYDNRFWHTYPSLRHHPLFTPTENEEDKNKESKDDKGFEAKFKRNEPCPALNKLILDNDYIKSNSLKELGATNGKIKATSQSIDTSEQTSRIINQREQSNDIMPKSLHEIIKDGIDFENEELKEEGENELKEHEDSDDDQSEIGKKELNEEKLVENASAIILQEEGLPLNKPSKEIEEGKETEAKQEEARKQSKKKRSIRFPRKKQTKQSSTEVINAQDKETNEDKGLNDKEVILQNQNKENIIKEDSKYVATFSINETKVKLPTTIDVKIDYLKLFNSIKQYFQSAQYFLEMKHYLISESCISSTYRRRRRNIYCPVSSKIRKHFITKRNDQKVPQLNAIQLLNNATANYLNDDKKAKYSRRNFNTNTFVPKKHSVSPPKRKSTRFSCDPEIIMTRFYQCNYEQRGLDEILIEIDSESSDSFDMPKKSPIRHKKTKEELELYQKLVDYESRNKEPSTLGMQIMDKSGKAVPRPSRSFKKQFQPLRQEKLLSINRIYEKGLNPLVLKRSTKGEKDEVKESKSPDILETIRKLSLLTPDDYAKKLTQFLDYQMSQSDQSMKRKLEERINRFRGSLSDNAKRREQYRKYFQSKIHFQNTAIFTSKDL